MSISSINNSSLTAFKLSRLSQNSKIANLPGLRTGKGDSPVVAQPAAGLSPVGTATAVPTGEKKKIAAQGEQLAASINTQKRVISPAQTDQPVLTTATAAANTKKSEAGPQGVGYLFGDLNNDGAVDSRDLTQALGSGNARDLNRVQAYFGQNIDKLSKSAYSGADLGDLNGDGRVDTRDLSAALSGGEEALRAVRANFGSSDVNEQVALANKFAATSNPEPEVVPLYAGPQGTNPVVDATVNNLKQSLAPSGLQLPVNLLA